MKMPNVLNKNSIMTGLVLVAALVALVSSAAAREVEYTDSELAVVVSPGQPTQIKFPGDVVSGYKNRTSALSLERNKSDLIVFAKEGLPDAGESIIVRLKDNRSYMLRIQPASESRQRDDVLTIEDNRSGMGDEDEDEITKRDKNWPEAPANSVSGLMREMILVAEFGKKSIPGFRRSDRYKGEVVLDDGTMKATVSEIFLGANLWGYVIDAENALDQTQKINPATFRIDGTRAVSAEHWELAPKPLNVEQQIAGRDKTKIYVITKSKS